MATYDNLIENLLDIIRKVAQSVFKKEMDQKKYLKHNSLGSVWRAVKFILVIGAKSFKPMVKVLALAIANHRLEMHNQNNQKEVDKLKRRMSDDEIEASTRGWSG